jgi:hypothetical protein
MVRLQQHRVMVHLQQLQDMALRQLLALQPAWDLPHQLAHQ